MKERCKTLIVPLLFISLIGSSDAARFEIRQDIEDNSNFWLKGSQTILNVNNNQRAYLYFSQAITFLQNNDVASGNIAINNAKNGFLMGLKEKENIVSYNGLIKVAFFENNKEDAEKWISKAFSFSENDETQFLKAKFLMMQDKFSEAKGLLQIILKNNNNKLALLALSEISIKDKLYSEAEKYLNSALKLDTEFLAVYKNLAALYKIQGKKKEAVSVLLEGYDRFSNDVNKAVVIANSLVPMYVEFGQQTKALQLSHSLYERYPDEVNALNLYLDVLVIYRQQAKAEAILEKKVEQSVLDIDSRTKLIFLLINDIANKNTIIKLYNEIISIRKDDPTSYIALNHYLVKNQAYLEAEKNISNVRKTFVNSNFADVLSGDLAIAQNKKDRAVEYYLKGYKIKKNNNLLVKIVQVLNTSNQKRKAIELLINDIKTDNRIAPRILLAGIYLSTEQYAQAEEQYRTVIDIKPNHYIALNDLAWLLSQINKDDEALIFAEKAFKIAPSSNEVIDTYTSILMKVGQNEMAGKILKHLKK